MFARETMTVGKWYGRSLPVPAIGTRSYVPFLVGSVGIVRSVLQDNLGKKIRILFRNVDTAEADQGKAEIVINESFLKGYFPGMRLDSDRTIATILGIIVHEAAHFAYSPATLTPWAEYVRKQCKKSGILYNDMVARTLGNIVEDIYIESEIERRVPTLSWMLDATNRVFFSAESEAKVVEEAEGITAAPVDFLAVGKLLNVLILAKTRKSISVNPFVDDLFFTVRKAARPLALKARFALAYQVYAKLMSEMGKVEESGGGEAEEGEPEEGEGSASMGRGEPGEGEPSKKDSGESDAGEGDETGEDKDAPADAPAESEDAPEPEPEPKSSKSGETEPDSTGTKALEEAAAKAKGLTATPTKKRAAPSESDMARTVERTLEHMSEGEFHMEGDDFRGGDSLLVVETPLRSGSRLESDSRYDRLSEVARQRATVNRPYGMDRNRGTHIRKLHRIATDGKIFAEPVMMNNYKPMQVVILLDCSGSMKQHVRVGGSFMTLVEAAAKATLGAAEGLVNGRCEVAVYGHTADTTYSGEVTIYKAKEFSEPIEVLAPRLGWLVSDGDLAENKDGHAIRYVANKFVGVNKRRLLIVVSDGVPQAPSYFGTEANRHTHDIVQEVRAKGIDVLSISITESARTTNNYIYGEEWNVFNHDPNVIESIVRSLIVK